MLAAALVLGAGLAGALLLGYAAREADAQTATAGKVFAWGENHFGYGHGTVPDAARSGVRAIAAGEYHNVVLKEDGSVFAWGRNSQGQSSVPDAARSGVKAVAAGSIHSLALTENGSVVAWGDNNFGELNVPDAAKSDVKAIAAGGYHSLALKTDGTVVAWGRDNYGQTTQIPDNAKSGVKAVAGGLEHSMVLKDNGSVILWGYDGYNLASVPAGAGSGIKAIASGWNHALALKEDGSVVAWGDDYYGQSSVPSGLTGVKAIAAGEQHSLALKEDGSVVAWGDKYNERRSTAVPSSARAGVEAISAGRWHSVALKTDATPPAAVGSFAAAVDPVGGRVGLSWKNPTDADFTAVRVLRSTNGLYTSSPEPNAEQTLVYEGTAESFTDTGLTNGTQYKYTAFAYDGKNFSEWATTPATPYDTTLPDTTLADGGPTGVVAAASAAFGFTSTEEGSTFECSLDGAGFENCTSERAYENLDDGPHSFEVRAVDAARNADPTPPRREWTVDTGPPNTSITSGPSGTTRGVTAAFGLSSTERGSTFECRLDDAPFGPCDPQKTYENLADGFHVFEARAVDAAGTTDPTTVRRTWSVDTAAPNTGITEGPSGTITSAAAAFEFLATEPSSTFECSLDGADFAACESPEELRDLSDGSHTFRVRATDAAGNADDTPASRTWSVDANAPGAPVITSPADNSYDTDGAFIVRGTAEKGAKVSLFDGGDPKGTATASAAGGAWMIALTDVADGRHRYTAKATDDAANDSGSSATRTITVDKVGPAVVEASPSGGEKGVAAGANVIVTFSEAMNPATVSTSTVKLLRGGNVVPARVTLAAGAKRVTLDPGANLVAGASYKVVVGARVTDTAGNPLSAAKVWRFNVRP